MQQVSVCVLRGEWIKCVFMCVRVSVRVLERVCVYVCDWMKCVVVHCLSCMMWRVGMERRE